MAGNQCKDVTQMNREIVLGIEGLTKADADRYRNEGPRAGENLEGGVGLVRVAECKDVTWMEVRCNALPEKFCKHHPDKAMGLCRTGRDSSHNLQDALFYKCFEDIGDDNSFVACGYNIYIMIDRAEAMNQKLADPDIRLIAWTSKMQNP
jgi:hypothetical protein